MIRRRPRDVFSLRNTPTPESVWGGRCAASAVSPHFIARSETPANDSFSFKGRQIAFWLRLETPSNTKQPEIRSNDGAGPVSSSTADSDTLSREWSDEDQKISKNTMAQKRLYLYCPENPLVNFDGTHNVFISAVWRYFKHLSESWRKWIF